MTATKLTQDEERLLIKINQYSEGSRRTDVLARCMRTLYGGQWDLHHTPFIGLKLRALGLVSTFKDSNTYARWDVTPVGRAVVAELENMGKKPAKEAPVTVPQPEDYWVRCKGDNTFKAYSSYEQAEVEAKRQAAGGRTPEIYAVRKVATVTQVPAHFEVHKP